MQWISPLRLHPIILAMLLLAGFSAAACRDGGPSTTPDPDREGTDVPVITGLELLAGELTSGETAKVKANTTGLATRWNWDFGAGVAPQVTTLAEPDLLMSTPGRYSGQVRASNAFGVSKPFTFGYSIGAALAPEIGEPFAPFEAMATGSTMRFTLPLSRRRGRPALYEWQVTGGELIGPTNNSVVAYRASTPGTHTILAKASNAHGSIEKEGQCLNFQAPVITAINRVKADEVSRGCVRIAASMIPDPDSNVGFRWVFTSPYVALNLTGVSGGVSESVVAPPPQAASGERVTGRMRACVDDWVCSQWIEFDFPGDELPRVPTWNAAQLPLSGSGTLAIIDGRPCVAMQKQLGEMFSTGTLISYAEPTSAEPRQASEWQFHDVLTIPTSQGSARYLLLTERNGRPLIAFENRFEEAVFLEATTANPRSAGDWREVDGGPLVKARPSERMTASASGELWAFGRGPADGELVFYRHPAQPLDPASWTATLFAVAPQLLGAMLLEFAGQPVILGTDNDATKEVYCLTSLNAATAANGEWTGGPITSPSTQAYLGGATVSESGILLTMFTRPLTEENRVQRIMHTSNPAGGPSAWSSVAGPVVDYPYVSLQQAIANWRGRPVQLNRAPTYFTDIAICRPLDSSPQAASDWWVHTPQHDVGPSDFLIATNSHLYHLGLVRDQPPILLWTTEDF